MVTEKDVAQWMLDEVLNKGYLEQCAVVHVILKKFGNDFVYQNDNGNLAIEKKVLNIFNNLSSDNVVWLKSERAWSPRKEHHALNRQQY